MIYWRRSSVFIVNFEHSQSQQIIQHTNLHFLFIKFEHVIAC